MLKIDKGVELEPRGRTNSESFQGFLRQLEIGDSFLLEGYSIHSSKVGAVRKFQVQEHWRRKKLGLKPLKFSCRTVDGGVRVWRVE